MNRFNDEIMKILTIHVMGSSKVILSDDEFAFIIYSSPWNTELQNKLSTRKTIIEKISQ